MKALFLLCFPLLLCRGLRAQETNTFDLRRYLSVRKSFTSPAETRKPAEFSYSKRSKEDAVFDVNAALVGKPEFPSGPSFWLDPAIQFNYSTASKKPREQLSTLLGLHWFVYDSDVSPANILLEPSVEYSKDFKSKLGKISTQLVLSPRNSQIHMYDVTQINYSDLAGGGIKWGWIPLTGFGHEKSIKTRGGRDEEVRALHPIGDLQFALRFHHFQFTSDFSYQKELIERRRTFLEWISEASWFLDRNERTSINLSIDRKWKPSAETAFKISLGFKL